MAQYKTINPGEDLKQTIKLLEKNMMSSEELTSWEAREKKQKQLNVADCAIYKRGQVWVIEHGGVVLYYETHNENYPFFETAFHFMNPGDRKKWKTVAELITFRQAIREATVQGTDYCQTILEEPLTEKKYRRFMQMARAHDLVHHGQNTF